MKRVLAVAVVGLALALPAQALGAVSYSGKLNGIPDSTFDFETKRDGGKRSVRSITAMKIPMTCDGGPASYGFQYNTAAPVHADRSFRWKRDFGDGTIVRVLGDFAAGFDKATGTVKAVTESSTDHCHSQKLEWKVHED